MASKIKKGELQTEIGEVIGVQNELEAIPNVDDVRQVKMEREKLEKVLDNHVKYVFKLKSRLNMLVPINRLPVELFTYIIRLVSKGTRGKYPSYISCTWVCHHWRFVLIQTPNLWTTLQLGTRDCDEGPPITPFDREFLKRSKSAGLNIHLLFNYNGLLPMLKEFFVKESNRIHTLNFHELEYGISIPLALSKFRFPSLKGLIHHSFPFCNDDLCVLLPCITTSDRLETLGIELWDDLPTSILDQLAPVFGRVRRLSLTINRQWILQFVLDTLRNNTKLCTLKLTISISNVPIFEPIIWPELKFLSINNATILQNVQAPKLTTLHLQCNRLPHTFKDNSILKEFDYSSIKYLNILPSCYDDAYYIVGSKETAHPKCVLSMTSEEDFLDKIRLIDGSFVAEEILSDTWKHGCFRLEIGIDAFDRALEEASSTIFPRLTALSEICFMPHTLSGNRRVRLYDILIRVPSLEKLIASNNASMDFFRRLRNASLCPQLKYLSFSAEGLFLKATDNLNFTEDLGKLLVECVQSRYKLYGNVLEYIVLGNCPPLPGNCLDKCKKLGTTVITEWDRKDYAHQMR